MTKTLFWKLAIATVLCCGLMPTHSFADKFFEDDDAFFLKYLKQDKFSLDTSAPAIVLYECTSYDMSSGKVHIRKIIKILKKSGMEYADISIHLFGSYSGHHFASINKVHGTTYNLEQGKITRQRIDKDNIDVETSDIIHEKKIAMPAVHEGSIIDYSYELENISTSKWDIQEAIPKLYTKLELCVPEWINMITDDPIVPVFIETDENKRNTIDSLLPYSYTFKGFNPYGIPLQSWVRRNVHAFEDEPYIPNENDYRERMLIYINSIHALGEHGILNSWDKINEALVESYYFYRPINAAAGSLKKEAEELAGNDNNELSIAKRTYGFVCDSISSSGYSSMFSDRDLSKILDKRSGNSAEVNLLLIALLRHQGLSCSPVILATKDNATPSIENAEFVNYNHVICQLRINGEKYYLDASEKYNPFGRIPPDCLNGYARVIDKNKKDTCGVIFKPEMAKEKALFSVTTTNNSLNNYTLNFKLCYGDEASIDKREKWNNDTTEIKEYVHSFIKDLSLDTKLIQYKVLNLNDPEKQLTLDFDISITWPDAPGSVIYFNPYAVKFFESNPFKNPKRKYPVELPATQNITYTFNLKLPNGYTVDEIPKSGIIKIDETDQYKNMLDYTKETNTLTVYSRLLMQHIFYPTDQYDILKEFFQKMGDEQQKTLVIKKL